jgi:hypothetical protein
MFRDESTKVMQKAHAQWGVDPAEGSGSSPIISPSYSSSGARSSVARTPSSSSNSSPTSANGNLMAGLPPTTGHADFVSGGMAMVKSLGTSWSEKGMQFFIDHYLVGFPDEPKTHQEVGQREWLSHPSIQTVMSAVGLAGLSNLTGNEEMRAVAWQHYGSGLQTTGKSLANRQQLRLDVLLRAVVMLALFEVGHGPLSLTESVQNANTH